MLLGAGKKLMFAEGDMILAARVKRAGYVTMGHQQLRVLALAQRRQQAIFTGAGGAHQPNQFSGIKRPSFPGARHGRSGYVRRDGAPAPGRRVFPRR